jgi:hypothetical protein
MKRSFLVVIAMCAALANAKAQSRECGLDILKKHYGTVIPDLNSKIEQTKQQIMSEAQAMSANSAMKGTAGTVTIPVVFHIILAQVQIDRLGGATGIAERIDSQMAVINRDFNKENPDANLIPAPFKPLHGSANIRFALARRTPNGDATNGYEIITTTKGGFTESSSVGSGMGFTEAKFLDGKPTAWNPDKYLNIWVVCPLNDNNTSSSILGLAVPPSFLQYGIPGFTKNELGVVLNYGAFGKKTGSFYHISGINGGRTLTHELGHFFEIWHIWGDDDGKCPGSGGDDDGINDTPPQAGANYGCPAYPLLDACTNTADGVMFMNFMDYVNDGCMQMFTHEQANVMYATTTAGNGSYTLTQNPDVLQLPVTSVNAINNDNSLELYPNPAVNAVNITISGDSKYDFIQLSDGMGRVLNTIQVSGQSAGKYSIDLSGYTKGIYYVKCSGAGGTTVKKLLVQ